MEYLLSSFGLHNPYIKCNLPEHAIFPISNDSQKGIDLDYTSLLIGKKYLIDIDAFKFITSGEKDFLKPMAFTLNFLKKEGFLDLLDTKQIIARNLEKLTEKVEKLSDNSKLWHTIIGRQWNEVKKDYIDFHKQFGSKENFLLNTCPFPIYNYLYSIGEIDNVVKFNQLQKLIESKKRNLTIDEETLIKEITKPLLFQILLNELLQSETHFPILDWEDNEFYYDQISLLKWDKSHDNTKIFYQAKKLFDVIIPSLKPNNIEQVVKFINNSKNVKSLRSQLIYNISNGIEISEEWYKEYINEIFTKELNTKRNMKYFKWIGTIAGLIIPGGSLIQEVGMELTQNIAEDKLENYPIKSFRWYYALQKVVKK